MDALSLEVDPIDGPIDGPSAFRLHGARPGTDVHLDIATVDGAGHHWASQGDYRVDPHGMIVPSDPDKPWWNMAFVDRDCAPVAFTSVEGSLDYRVSASTRSASSSTIISRSWGANLVREDLAGDGWRLRVFIPDGWDDPGPGIVFVPGTSGVDAAAPTAALLASHGYVTAVLSYMRDPGLPTGFQEIPLEAIDAGLAEFARHDAVDACRVGVYSASVGTAVVFSALSRIPTVDVRAVVAIAPAHVVVQALAESGRPQRTSSLSQGGKPLPYMPVRSEKLIGQIVKSAVSRTFSREPSTRALALRPAYAAGLRDADAVARSLIPVDKIDAPILAIAGEDDRSYPAVEMARALMSLRTNTSDRLIVLNQAGHVIRPPATPTTVDRGAGIISGGTPAGIARGQRDAWTAALDFLETQLCT